MSTTPIDPLAEDWRWRKSPSDQWFSTRANGWTVAGHKGMAPQIDYEIYSYAGAHGGGISLPRMTLLEPAVTLVLGDVDPLIVQQEVAALVESLNYGEWATNELTVQPFAYHFSYSLLAFVVEKDINFSNQGRIATVSLAFRALSHEWTRQTGNGSPLPGQITSEEAPW